MFLNVLCRAVSDLNWLCHASCLMTLYYHLLIETPEGNLSAGMRQLHASPPSASTGGTDRPRMSSSERLGAGLKLELQEAGQAPGGPRERAGRKRRFRCD